MNLIYDFILGRYDAMERELDDSVDRLNTVEQQLLALPDNGGKTHLLTQIRNQKIRLSHEKDQLLAARTDFTERTTQ